MGEKNKGFMDRWFFHSSKNAPELRHEFPLHDISDNLHFGEDPGALTEEKTFNRRDPQHENSLTNDKPDKFS